jgi:hypothetical protein
MHKKLFSWLTLFGLLTAFTVSAAAATAPAAPATSTAATPMLGRIIAKRVVGDVKYENIATKVISSLADNVEIAQGTIVRTGPSSSVMLLFSNGASINLGYDSELNIEQFVQNPFDQASFKPAENAEEPSVSTTKLKLTRGELVGKVMKLKASQGSKFTVGTPVGAAGIRGTTFRIVYRPTGNGQAFNFTITTVEGNVEVEVASGTVTAPPVAVTDNQEIVINNVEVNPVTNEVTVTTPNGQVVSLTAAPPPTVNDAPVTSLQLVQSVATNLASEILAAVFTAPSTPAPPGAGGGGGGSGETTNGGGGGGGGTGYVPDDSNSKSSGYTPPSTDTTPGAGGR